MHYKSSVFLFLISLAFAASAQNKKLDTTMNMGKAGYRITCNNKNPEKNSVTITPVGFDNTARGGDIEVLGKVKKAEVEDFNNDGYPDLLVYVNSGAGGNFINVIAFAAEGNQSIKPIAFPDILIDAKLRIGYKGYDSFTLIQGTVMRHFPVYDVTDEANPKPTGMIRHIQYGLMPAVEGSILKFKVLRSYETNAVK